MKKGISKLLIFEIAILCICILGYIVLLFFNDISNGNLVFILENVRYSFIAIGSLSIILLMKKKANILLISLMLGYSIALFLHLYLLPHRIAYTIYLIFLFISMVYCNISIIHFIKTKNNIHILNSIFPSILTFLSFLSKSNYLDEFIEMDDNNLLLTLLITGLSLSIMTTIFYLIIVKDRTNKGEYIGKLLMIISPIIIGVLVIPHMLIQNMNYSFDKNVKQTIEVIIVKKQEAYHKWQNGYYFYIDTSEENNILLTMNPIIFSEYDEGDTIVLKEYKGFFGLKYYEYEWHINEYK